METAENEGSAWVPVLTSYNGEHHAHTARKGRYMKRVKTLIPGNKKKRIRGSWHKRRRPARDKKIHVYERQKKHNAKK